MTFNRYLFPIAVCALALAGCGKPADAPAPAAATASKASAAAAPSAPVSAEIPRGFSSYASESIGDNKQCVAGASLDDDGMNQRPVAYVAQTSGKPIWAKTLDLPAETYQSRATHCLRQGDTVYVLLQSDTQPQQTLSQTSLKVIKLSLADGAVQGSGDIAVPGAQGAYSAWVEEGAQHMSWQDGGLRIVGQYFALDAPDQRSAFQVALKPELMR
ncbi:hypothetical protein [Pseudomonas sp. CGJS7]|uniref:hypothetical protein n=1 Tax=Pseudomonas sp. CGJS7 TaxID=3109348 RepID=UPI003008CD11